MPLAVAITEKVGLLAERARNEPFVWQRPVSGGLAVYNSREQNHTRV
jgi:hypothetical protein